MENSVISVKDLSLSYDGKGVILKKISFDVLPGEVIGYIGPNGAGKTTTLKILTGILNNFSGEVKILGYDIKKEKIAYKYKIGYLP